MSLNTEKIDLINIGLIIVSLVIAYWLPFELFLFSYAILGPLHYLTEINWLHKKKYFISHSKNWMIFFLGIALLLSVYPIVQFAEWGLSDSHKSLVKLLGQQVNTILLASFFFAISLIFLKNIGHLFIALAFSVLIAFSLNKLIPFSLIFIGVFLPTLIHVYLFTFFFILYGALKSKSKYGYYLSLLLLSIPFIIIFIPVNANNYHLSQYIMKSFENSGMLSVSSTLARALGLLENNQFKALSEIGIRIQIFIAFAYTYHYLNWFSKTSVIGWKKTITTQKSVLISLVWLAAVSIYIYDGRTGFVALFFLSFLHVFLEFPLNVLTIKEIGSFRKVK